jgi:hypothetical protein
VIKLYTKEEKLTRKRRNKMEKYGYKNISNMDEFQKHSENNGNHNFSYNSVHTFVYIPSTIASYDSTESKNLSLNCFIFYISM